MTKVTTTMAGIKLQLPTIQNWSCHNCSGCCRQHVIEITDEERQRIERQGWDSDPDMAGVEVILSQGGKHRLAHRPNGACVFLNEDGLCRIHARFDEAAKPLACRVYPYAFHPRGDGLAVSLRFSCPSVVKNLGEAVSGQSRELNRIAQQVLPGQYHDPDPPLIKPDEQLTWPEFEAFLEMYDRLLADAETPLLVRLLRLLFLTDLIEDATFEKVRGGRLSEFLELVGESALLAVTELPEPALPRSVARRHLRMLVAQYTRRDTMADADAGLAGYWRRFRTSIGFVRGKGEIPVVREEFSAASFSAIEEPFDVRGRAAIDQVLTRYFRVKVQGIHFCGPAYYHVPLVEGLRSLLLVYPAVMWLARWHASSRERSEVLAEDVETALAIVDHNHGYSEALGLRASRMRVRVLAAMKQIGPLCLWYARETSAERSAS